MIYLFFTDCGSPEALSGTTVTVTSTTHGGQATYVCANGHTGLTGSSTRTCGNDGTWSGSAPSCDQIGITIIT